MITPLFKQMSLYDWTRENGYYGDLIAQECTCKNSDGLEIDPFKIDCNSCEEVGWRCSSCGHEWFSGISNRTRLENPETCPSCNYSFNYKMLPKTKAGSISLLDYCRSEGDYGLQLIQEYHGTDEAGNYYPINEIPYGSHEKLLFECINAHTWYSSVKHRTISKSMCRYCNNNSTSYSEQLIYWCIKQIYPEAQNRHIILKEEYSRGIEYDIAIPLDNNKHVYIEYSPTNWHKNKERDILKKDICDNKGIRFIQIIDDSKNEYSHVWEDNIIIDNIEHSKDRESMLLKVVDHILNTLGHSISEIDIELAKKEAWEKSKLGRIEYEKSLEFIYPELSKEWHKDLNGTKNPRDITPGSGYIIYWTCTKCGYGANGEWSASLANRTGNGHKTGCPKCGYKWYENNEYEYIYRTKIEEGVNDLATTHPELVKEYHEVLNTIPANKIGYTYKEDTYWKCTKCGYGNDGEWKAPPIRRTARENETGCPNCGYHWNDGEYHYVNRRPIIQGDNDLLSKYPELAKEYSLSLNDELPNEIRYNCSKKKAWECIKCHYGKDGEWQIKPVDRTNAKSGCPNCGYNWYKATIGETQKLKKIVKKSTAKSHIDNNSFF